MAMAEAVTWCVVSRRHLYALITTPKTRRNCFGYKKKKKYVGLTEEIGEEGQVELCDQEVVIGLNVGERRRWDS